MAEVKERCVPLVFRDSTPLEAKHTWHLPLCAFLALGLEHPNFSVGNLIFPRWLPSSAELLMSSTPEMATHSLCLLGSLRADIF